MGLPARTCRYAAPAKFTALRTSGTPAGSAATPRSTSSLSSHSRLAISRGMAASAEASLDWERPVHVAILMSPGK